MFYTPTYMYIYIYIYTYTYMYVFLDADQVPHARARPLGQVHLEC